MMYKTRVERRSYFQQTKRDIFRALEYCKWFSGFVSISPTMNCQNIEQNVKSQLKGVSHGNAEHLMINRLM